MRADLQRWAIVCGITAAGLSGAAFPRYSVEDIVDGSQWIVEGTVGASHAEWDAAHKFIWTHFEVRVLDALRGNRQAAITVSEPGGILQGIEQTTSGTVPYTAGEHVVLFLYRTPIGYLRVAGGGQGKFLVGQDGRTRVSSGGMTLMEVRRGAGDRGTGIESVNGLSLGEFKTRIRAMAGSRTR